AHLFDYRLPADAARGGAGRLGGGCRRARAPAWRLAWRDPGWHRGRVPRHARAWTRRPDDRRREFNPGLHRRGPDRVCGRADGWLTGTPRRLTRRPRSQANPLAWAVTRSALSAPRSSPAMISLGQCQLTTTLLAPNRMASRVSPTQAGRRRLGQRAPTSAAASRQKYAARIE